MRSADNADGYTGSMGPNEIVNLGITRSAGSFYLYARLQGSVNGWRVCRR